MCLYPQDTTWEVGRPTPQCAGNSSWSARCPENPVCCPCTAPSTDGHRSRVQAHSPPFGLSHPPQVPEEMSRCRNSYTEQELKPLTLEALGRLRHDESADYQHFLQDCVDSLFKEVKEKFKGWVSYSTSEQAELSYKKVSLGPVVSQSSSSSQDSGSSEARPCGQLTSLWASVTHSFLVDLASQVIQFSREEWKPGQQGITVSHACWRSHLLKSVGSTESQYHSLG